ncbi:hypothetical protein HXX76_015361 [Chlamydomonas incerta]|uniref:Uncharacterized protein n=1 Tax=Chlamydomonas incerta TaxID=51695 RepID=A0A835SP04_CHLIN|nr:hypothetical protein HXX76_015361 [Chlamydomonas incerta]|eukprot:KAG2423396.1 hypothetical protein HXX76_015361 [Chlamydomonas incerta]
MVTGTAWELFGDRGAAAAVLGPQGRGDGSPGLTVGSAINQKLDTILARQEAIAQQNAVIAQQNAEIAQQQEAIIQQQEAIAQQQEAIAQQQEAIAQQQEAMAQQQEAMAQQQEAILTSRKWGITEWAPLELGPSPDTPINVIPMHGGVEHAFGSHRVMVLPSTTEDGEAIFALHVLDPELLQKTVHGEYKSRQFKASSSWVEPPPELAAIKFMDINKQPLRFVAGSDMRPAKRCCMVHAVWSLAMAKAMKWPVDPGISVSVDSFGWKSPTFMEARERTAMWVTMQRQVTFDGPRTVGSIDDDGLTTGSVGSGL